MYKVDILIPTARFVFSVEDGRTDVLPEFRSPEAFDKYRRLRDERPVVGMTTFPNTVLLRGERTIVVDPGLPLQNEPVVRALEARGRGPGAGVIQMRVRQHDQVDVAWTQAPSFEGPDDGLVLQWQAGVDDDRALAAQQHRVGERGHADDRALVAQATVLIEGLGRAELRQHIRAPVFDAEHEPRRGDEDVYLVHGVVRTGRAPHG